MFIADGRRTNVIAEALDGRCGTQFVPRPTRLRSRQRWIAYGVVPKGAVTVNEGAQQRLMDEGKSLLPAGVTHVSGHFQSGDLVRLTDSHGHAFAQGFVNYSHTELSQIMGRQTAEIPAILGTTAGAEVIHRDNLVLDV